MRTELLIQSSNRSRCAYKGSASYWSVQIGGRLVEDLVWAYRDPKRDAEEVRDLLCFFNERVDLEVEGETIERPGPNGLETTSREVMARSPCVD